MGALAVAAVVLGALPSGPAEAGLRLRVGPVAVVRMAMGGMLGLVGARRTRMAHHGRIRTAALGPQDRRAAESGRAGNRLSERAQLTAFAALSGWHGGHSAEGNTQASAQGWWRHADGSYGWVGPLFWPYAADDLADFIVFGNSSALFGYGYPDINAAIFAPYGASELAAYLPGDATGRRSRKVPAVKDLCGNARGEEPGFPIERIAQDLRLNEAQRTGLDQLAAAWTSADKTIASSCPAEAPANGLDRLATMQSRLAAMISAVDAVQPSLSKFYELLDDNQKARLDVLGADSRPQAAEPLRKGRRTASADRTPREALAAACQAEQQGEPSLDQLAEQFSKVQWPLDEIAGNLHLDDTQRAALEVLQDTSLKALELQSASCRAQGARTMPARVEVVKAQLEAMLQAAKEVADALDDFYFNLSEEQKTQFEAIGPQRGA
ncbi:conserved exported hypothetical protein [Bradyrhizobium sp. STM 3843]|uniref:Spy/CpxP family protein refolding chaperone n=1 Tax=Bradyrhizobium sp. STM 3843 TaxID=551947 RepID=UPI000240355E|nr:Spy/CpxP family protein refolding chaperone [Bradyrhizobium sp. STM 3843]CCE08954.1 conserved exported hypothetical protein [Bradyrhizobium sp. STM 3843]